LSAVAAGASMLVSLVGLLWRRQRRHMLLPAPPHGPNRTRQAAMGRVLGGRWLISTGNATLRLRRRGRPDSLAVSDEVAEAVATQTIPWQPASHYSMRVGEAVETSIVKLCGDPPGRRELILILTEIWHYPSGIVCDL
jgi:hypothetical protein